MAGKYFRPIALFTGIITLLQAIAWFVLSLIAVLAYRCELPIPVYEDVQDQFTVLLYYFYFQGPTCPADVTEIAAAWPDFEQLPSNLYATPQYISGWTAAYLALNITYFLIAIGLLINHCKSKDGTYPLNIIRLWTLNTLAFLIMDFWLTVVWGVDYRNLTDFVADHDGQEFGWATAAPGALMAITARGFILYVINFALFIYFGRYFINWSALVTGFHDGVKRTSSLRRVPHSQQNVPRRRESDDWVANGQDVVPYRRNQLTYSNEAYQSDWHNAPRQQEVDAEPQFQQSIPRRPLPILTSRDDSFQPRQPESRPPLRSTFQYPNRKNFEQGPGPSRGHAPAKVSDMFY